MKQTGPGNQGNGQKKGVIRDDMGNLPMKEPVRSQESSFPRLGKGKVKGKVCFPLGERGKNECWSFPQGKKKVKKNYTCTLLVPLLHAQKTGGTIRVQAHNQFYVCVMYALCMRTGIRDERRV